jgi:hypothetical protein
MADKARFWKINCMEDKYPGLWHTWFKEQVVAVGWPPPRWKLESQSKHKRAAWNLARRSLLRMMSGDRIVVQLKDWRIGRIGTVLELKIEDEEWNPTVPAQGGDCGEQGRRIEVRWDLTTGPLGPESAIRLPVEARPNMRVWRPTLTEMPNQAFESIEKAALDENNWANILRGFVKERAMSEFISESPHHLEDGLRPYPSKKARELVFMDGSRLDVLLLDRDNNIVIVECKQGAPTTANIQQLRRYMHNAEKLKPGLKVGKRIRGILVHGGARKLEADVRRERLKAPAVELVTFSVNVGFAPSS